MADHGFAKHVFNGDFMMNWPLCLTIGTGAEVTHTVNQVSLGIRCLFCNVQKTLLNKIPIKTPDALIDFFLRSEPALIQKIARPDDIETCFCQKTDGSLPPLGSMIGRIQGNLPDVLIPQRLTMA